MDAKTEQEEEGRYTRQELGFSAQIYIPSKQRVYKCVRRMATNYSERDTLRVEYTDTQVSATKQKVSTSKRKGKLTRAQSQI